jgi:hypothetical protein
VAVEVLPPLCVVTFVTRGSRCCYFAAHMPPSDPDTLQIPPHVRSQLDAVAARLAWIYFGPPHDLLVKGEAWNETPPVERVLASDVGRLVIC